MNGFIEKIKRMEKGRPELTFYRLDRFPHEMAHWVEQAENLECLFLTYRDSEKKNYCVSLLYKGDNKEEARDIEEAVEYLEKRIGD